MIFSNPEIASSSRCYFADHFSPTLVYFSAKEIHRENSEHRPRWLVLISTFCYRDVLPLASTLRRTPFSRNGEWVEDYYYRKLSHD